MHVHCGCVSASKSQKCRWQIPEYFQEPIKAPDATQESYVTEAEKCWGYDKCQEKCAR